MKFLVAFACLLAVAAAKPGFLTTPYGAQVIHPSGFSYSTASVTPLTYAAPYAAAYAAPVVHHTVAAAPLAHTVAAAPIAHAIATPVAAAVAVPDVAKTQYHAQDELGQASYGHAETFQSHNAVQDAAGNKVGSFSYVAPDGQVFATNYVADALGYRVATNALPVGPSAIPVGPVDTPEVVAARAAHLQEHAIVKSRARRSITLAAPLSYSALSPLAYTHAAPLAYSAAAPLAYSAATPLAYSAATPVAYHHAVGAAPVLNAATLTTVVNTPGHAVSYRVD